jgi:hypothetical protein
MEVCRRYRKNWVKSPARSPLMGPSFVGLVSKVLAGRPPKDLSTRVKSQTGHNPAFLRTRPHTGRNVGIKMAKPFLSGARRWYGKQTVNDD